MFVLGYVLAAGGFFFFYLNELLIGAALLMLGGVLAQRMSLCVRSIGFMIMILSAVFQFHNGFQPWLMIALVFGFAMANSPTKIGKRHHWGFAIDFGSAVSGGSGDGYGGGDGGGGE